MDVAEVFPRVRISWASRRHFNAVRHVNRKQRLTAGAPAEHMARAEPGNTCFDSAEDMIKSDGLGFPGILQTVQESIDIAK